MSIVKFPDPILLTPAEPFDFIKQPTDPHLLVKSMLQQMFDNNGVGLSANQVGMPYRVFVMRAVEFNYACFNPKIVHYGQQQALMEEGCLSYPGLIVKIKRPTEVRLRFQTASGAIDTKTFHGLTARIVQHEMDHLDGVAFYNRATRFHRDQAMRRVGKIK